MTIQVLHERGSSNREVARQLGVDEKAVRYRLAAEAVPFWNSWYTRFFNLDLAALPRARKALGARRLPPARAPNALRARVSPMGRGRGSKPL